MKIHTKKLITCTSAWLFIASAASAYEIGVADGEIVNSDGKTWSGIANTADWNNLQYWVEPIAEVASGGTLNMTGAKFENNSFTHNNVVSSGTWVKGAIYVGGGKLVMTDSEMTGTKSAVNPGDKSKWQGTPNTQGSAIHFSGASSSGEFENVKFSGNSASGMTVQGGTIVAWGGNYKFNNASFENNSALALAGSEASVSGGALYMTDNWSGGGTIAVDISNSSFSGNRAEGNIVNAGAIIYESYQEGSSLSISGASFDGNMAVGASRAEGGAMRIFTTSSSEKTVFNDVSFTNNAVEVSAPADTLRNGGGAIYSNASDLVFNVTKDAAYSGNYVSAGGEKSDYYGGFLRLSSYNGEGSSATFNVSGGATLAIGNGAAGYDSISSTDALSSIVKSGAGILSVNSSMEHFTGSLSVSEGSMSASGKIGASSITVAQGASLGLVVSGDNTLSNSGLALSNAGTLILTSGAQLASGQGYALSANSAISDFGAVKAYGGTFSAGVFTAGSVKKVESVNETQTISNAETLVVAETVSFAAASDSSSHISVSRAEDITSQISEFNAITAWGFDVSGVDAENTIVLSFAIGHGYDMSQISVMHRGEDGAWSDVTSLLEGKFYADGVYGFVADSFSDYALAAVPEPAACAAILGAAALAIAAFRRRR